MAKVGVVFIHGMGAAKRGYSKKCREKLQRALGKDAKQFMFREVLWASEFNRKQEKLFAKMKGSVDFDGLRSEVVLGGLGDAVQYTMAVTQESDAFFRTIVRVEKATESLRNAGAKRVVVISHSLGCLLANDYYGQEPFDGWITFGCNLPLFHLAGLATPPDMPKNPIGGKPWINVYDPDDLLGFPIEPLGSKFKAVCRDFSINTGGLLRSHTGYWTDRQFIALARDHLRRFI